MQRWCEGRAPRRGQGCRSAVGGPLVGVGEALATPFGTPTSPVHIAFTWEYDCPTVVVPPSGVVAQLRIRLCGGLAVERGGERLDDRLPSRQARIVFALPGRPARKADQPQVARGGALGRQPARGPRHGAALPPVRRAQTAWSRQRPGSRGGVARTARRRMDRRRGSRAPPRVSRAGLRAGPPRAGAAGGHARGRSAPA